MSRVRHGFTLIETLLVVTIMGVVIAMALPSVRRSSDRVSVRNARDVIASYANTARRASLTRNAPTRLLVTGNNIEVRMINELTNAESRIASPVDLEEAYDVTLTFSLADGSAAGDSEVRFDKHGIARGAAGGRKLLVVGSQGSRDSVCISGAGMVMRGVCP